MKVYNKMILDQKKTSITMGVIVLIAIASSTALFYYSKSTADKKNDKAKK